MIKNIMLDVGEVLIQWDPKTAMKKLGMSEKAAEEVFAALFLSGVWGEEDTGILSPEEILEFFISKVPKYENEIRMFWNHVETAASQYPYAKSWITQLKESGYGVYILSNYGKWTFEKTKKKELDFLPLVDGAVFSYEVKKVKPNPEIYEIIIKKYNLVPEECVFIDDRRENIEEAIKAGMYGIVFTNKEQAEMELQKLGVNLKNADGL